MIHDEEMDLLWADEPPGWVRNFGVLIDLWGNPVFQRRYVLWRLKPTLGPRRAFMVVFIFSLGLNLLFKFMADEDDAIWVSLFFSVVAPGSLVLAITSIRLFVATMITTPNELRNEISGDALGPILSTPIPDNKIFLAECFSGFMRGLGAVEELAAIVLGLIAPWTFVFWSKIISEISANGIHIFLIPAFAVMAIILLVLLLVLGCLAAGMFAVYMPTVATLPMTVFYVAAVWFGAVLFSSFVTSVTAKVIHLASFKDEFWLAALGFATLLILTVSVMTSLTGYMGIISFAKARRPGYFEDEYINAAGLMSRESGYRDRYGMRL